MIRIPRFRLISGNDRKIRVGRESNDSFCFVIFASSRGAFYKHEVIQSIPIVNHISTVNVLSHFLRRDRRDFILAMDEKRLVSKCDNACLSSLNFHRKKHFFFRE